jgi:putative aldouronate transport system permease protein
MVGENTVSDRIWNAVIKAVIAAAVAVTLYPLVYIVSMSISSVDAVFLQQVWFLPKGIQLSTYRKILADPALYIGFYNSLWYTAVGTVLSLAFTLPMAFALSRREFRAGKPMMVFVTVTMFLDAGLIPMFILINRLHLYNTRWSIILPVLISTYNLIIARVYFQMAIPDSIPEAARIDGCNECGIFARIVLPVSSPIIAVMTLYYAVAQWNSYFSALMYLPNAALHPVTMLLRKVILLGDMAASSPAGEDLLKVMAFNLQARYALIVLTILPILFLYPFLQKYFVKGIMIGSVKE